jgi:glutathione S-transferase
MSPTTLYGARISYYTGKVRAYLDWKGLPYTEVSATAEVYGSIVLPRVGVPVIPVVVTPEGDTLQDSTHIIETLEQRHGAPSITPGGGVQRLVAALLELYGDEWLIIPAMHYRWHHNRDWALQAFGQLNAPEAPLAQQRAIGAERAVPFAKAAQLLGANTPAMQSAIEHSYEALLDELNAHFARYDYVLGSRPSIADFGLYGPLYAHQYLDPASGALMRAKAPHVVRWVQRLETQAAPRSGDFLANDDVPDTLEPVLRRQMHEQWPVLVDTACRLRPWLADHPGEVAPRVLGQHSFTVAGETGERIVRPYSLWMAQRARDIYLALQGRERARADALLARVGGDLFRNFPDPPRLARRGLSVSPQG